MRLNANFEARYVWDHTTKDNWSFGMGNTHGMKIHFFLQV